MYIDVKGEEYQIRFEKKSRKGTEIFWSASLEQAGLDSSISFTESGTDLHGLEIPKEVETPFVVIHERIKNVLAILNGIESEGFEDTEEDNEESEAAITPYDPEAIKVRRDIYSISEVYRKIAKKDIDLNPDFQRHLVWDNLRKSRLIESVLLGIPLPVFYFAQEKDASFYVVDGLQRLSAIKDFMDNKFSLKKLEHLGAACNGKFYEAKGKIKEDKALERKYQRRLEDAQLNVNIIEASSPTAVKYDIFKRINEGGKPLNYQEIRNSLAKPHVRNFMKELVGSEIFISATGGKNGKPGVDDRRMGAQELVLRFAGFNMGLSYNGNMNEFLDNTLDALNKKNEKDLQLIGNAFERSLLNCYHAFGKYCFRKYLPDQLTEPNKPLFNKSLYVTWTRVFTEIPHDLVKKTLDFEGFAPILAQYLASDAKYFQIVTNKTSDKSSLETAFQKAETLIRKYFPQKTLPN